MTRILRSSLVTLLLAAAPAIAQTVPRPSPELAIKTVGGGQVLLSQYRGKVVAVLFILTECPHCQTTVTMLNKLQQEYGPRGFQAVASAINDMASLYVPDFIKRFQPPYPVGFNSRDAVLDFLQASPLLRMMMPQLVVVDRRYQIRAQYPGDDKFFEAAVQEKNLRSLIEPLLKESSTPKKTASAPVAKKKSGT